jgi:E3 ubiquitin-protein ligase RNF14
LLLSVPQMVKSVLSDEQNSRLESVELERTLNHMMDAVYCPRCSTISLEDEDNCAQCSNCFFAFCSLCNESWHPGTKCLSHEDKLELMRRRMAGTKSGDREFRKREAELQSLAHIEVS